MDLLSYLICLLESRFHSLCLARAIFIGFTRASKGVWVRSSWNNHSSVGVSFLYTLVVHDVLWVVLPISNTLELQLVKAFMGVPVTYSAF